MIFIFINLLNRDRGVTLLGAKGQIMKKTKKKKKVSNDSR